MKKIAIIMGSDSDLPVMKDCAEFLEELDIPYVLDIVSAHRTPVKMYQFAKDAYNNDIAAIVAGAGGAAHLPGMVASLTPLPVIGVPIKSAHLSGMDSLLSIVSMPPGIPVATMAVEGARNAGIFAARVLGIADAQVASMLDSYTTYMRDAVNAKSDSLQDLGYKDYLGRQEG